QSASAAQPPQAPSSPQTGWSSGHSASDEQPGFSQSSPSMQTTQTPSSQRGRSAGQSASVAHSGFGRSPPEEGESSPPHPARTKRRTTTPQIGIRAMPRPSGRKGAA